MGQLRRVRDDTRFDLPCRALLGRGAEAVVRIESDVVSRAHALVEWRTPFWWARDLGSRCGTWVGGERLDAGATATLGRGSVLALGDPEDILDMTSDAPPPAMAWDSATGTLRQARDGLLALPDPDRPEVVLFQDAESHWMVERMGEGARPVLAGEGVKCGGASWMLYLTGADVPTAGARAWFQVGTIALRFRPIADGSRVGVDLVHPSTVRRLEPKRCCLLLFELGRARLRDAALPDADQGWVEVGALMEALHTDKHGVDHLVYLSRLEFVRAGVVDGWCAVQVSGGRRRLAVRRIEVVPE